MYGLPARVDMAIVFATRVVFHGHGKEADASAIPDPSRVLMIAQAVAVLTCSALHGT